MNKITWITGAGTGIGKALAEKLTKENRLIAISGRRENLLEEIKSNFNNVKSFQLDVSDNSEVINTFNEIKKQGFVDCLVNNAGAAEFNLASEQSIEKIEQIITVNLLGSIYTIKSVLPEMIKQKQGTIINIISVVAEKIFKNSAAYTASKLGLLGFLDVLREEVREHNIKVINILPGATATPIWPENMLEKYAENMMDPEDVAECVYELMKFKGKAVPEKIVLRSLFGDL